MKPRAVERGRLDFHSMRKPLSNHLLKAAALLLMLGLVFALFAIGAYFSVFGPQSGYNLAKRDSAWSNFGSYVGGVLGPLFSFLAFGGVLLTVWLQAKQLDILHTQANHEEIQRVISNISSNIDTLLAQAPNQHIDHHRLRDAPITIFTVISAAGTAALSSPTDYVVQASHETLIAVSKAAIATEATAIGLELEQLAWCLQQYQEQNGSATVVEFYKRRYNPIVCWLDAIGRLDTHHRVQAYFEPKAFRKFLEP